MGFEVCPKAGGSCLAAAGALKVKGVGLVTVEAGAPKAGALVAEVPKHLFELG